MMLEVETLWGTITTRLSGETERKDAGVLENRTAETATKFSPLIATRVPSGPLRGTMASIWGVIDWGAAESVANRSRAWPAHWLCACGGKFSPDDSVTQYVVNRGCSVMDVTKSW